jgi:YebC/PmpR family DNA-binding regulatory protein
MLGTACVSVRRFRRWILPPLPHRLHAVPPIGLFQVRSMAGHNKWSKIKRKKGVKDVARADLFGKASKAIIVTSKNCRGDMANLQLQSAIQHAKSIQMTKERIQHAIDRHAEESKDDQAFQSIRYDAMLTLGGVRVACILTALTDNRNRTAARVRATVVRAGGELLPSSSHDYLFHHVGVVMLEEFQGDEAPLWECAIAAGATGVDVEQQSAMISCEPVDLWNLVTALRGSGYEPDQFEHRYVVADENTSVTLSDEGMEQLHDFLDKMDDDADVTHVYHNIVTCPSSLN